MAKIAKKLKFSKGVVHKTLAEREAGKLDAHGFKMTGDLWARTFRIEHYFLYSATVAIFISIESPLNPLYSALFKSFIMV